MHFHSIDEEVMHPDRLVGGQAFAIGWKVTDAANRSGSHGFGIENHDVGKGSRAENTAIGETEELCLDLSQFVNRLFESENLSFAHPTAEKIRGEYGIT